MQGRAFDAQWRFRFTFFVFAPIEDGQLDDAPIGRFERDPSPTSRLGGSAAPRASREQFASSCRSCRTTSAFGAANFAVYRAR